MFGDGIIPKGYRPCKEEVEKYLIKWNSDLVNATKESSLRKLFFELYPDNKSIEGILIKCSVLNAFYSTHIFEIYNVSKHYLSQRIDERLAKGDLTLVNDLSRVLIAGKEYKFYSFATKYCCHHRPDVYPIYDSYVSGLLKHFCDKDHFFLFKENELKDDYRTFVKVVDSFIHYYSLEDYSIRDIDKYLWLLGKDVANGNPIQ